MLAQSDKKELDGCRILSKRPGDDINDRRKYLARALEEYRRLVELGEQMPFKPTDSVNFDEELEVNGSNSMLTSYPKEPDGNFRNVDGIQQA